MQAPWKPGGTTSLSPSSTVPDPEEAVAQSCAAVFGTGRRGVIHDGDAIMHAECRIGDIVLIMGGADGAPAHLHLYRRDPDTAFGQAVPEDATVVPPKEEHGVSDRRGGVQSADGATWRRARQC